MNPKASFNVVIDSNIPDWNEYLARQKNATIYHDPSWGRIYQGAGCGRPFFLTAIQDGRIVGILQLIGRRSLLFGSHLCSLPYFDASGVIADNDMVRTELLEKAQDILATDGYRFAEIRQLTALADDVQTRTDKVTLWLELPNSTDEMWKQLKSKVRTKVRKVLKNKLEFFKGKAEFLDDFHDIYARRMRDLGSPPHGVAFFKRIMNEFPNETDLFIVRMEKRVVAAAFTLTDQWGVHVPWSASNTAFNHLGVNRFLYWHLLAHAADTKADHFDFGRSTVDSGTYMFKREWGAEPVQLYWHYFSNEKNEVAIARPDSGKYKWMVRGWKKFPLPVAKTIGPWLIRRLS